MPDAKRSRIGRALELEHVPTTLLCIQNARPLVALEMLRECLPGDQAGLADWRRMARVAAVMGSCPRSKSSFKSGLRHWITYIEITHGADMADKVAFPPSLEDVLAWSNTFRQALAFVTSPQYVLATCQVLWHVR